MRAFFKALGGILNVILIAWEKSQAKREAKAIRTAKEALERDPVAWFNARYGVRPPTDKATTAPSVEDVPD